MEADHRGGGGAGCAGHHRLAEAWAARLAVPTAQVFWHQGAASDTLATALAACPGTTASPVVKIVPQSHQALT